MALTATIYKATLAISDLRRHYYQPHQLTVALHPSEQPRRMMLRLLAFCLYADEALHFTKGVSSDDEPDLWQMDASGDIEKWIELGLVTEKRLKQACAKARHVVLITYNDNAQRQWHSKMAPVLQRFGNLSVLHLNDEYMDALETLASRNMDLQCTIDEDQIWLSTASESIGLKFTVEK